MTIPSIQRAFWRYFSQQDVDLDDKMYAKLALGTGPEAAEARRKCRKVQRITNIFRALYRRALSGDKESLIFVANHHLEIQKAAKRGRRRTTR